MIVCVTLGSDGQVGEGWGHSERLAVAKVRDDTIESWEEFPVGWDVLHDAGPHAEHHARIARFITDHKVERVIAGHMGPPMQQMLGHMGVSVQLGVEGDARKAVVRRLS
jgi:predicted Fe-Mo cluster-binding NifX family protein